MERERERERERARDGGIERASEREGTSGTTAAAAVVRFSVED